MFFSGYRGIFRPKISSIFCLDFLSSEIWINLWPFLCEKFYTSLIIANLKLFERIQVISKNFELFQFIWNQCCVYLGHFVFCHFHSKIDIAKPPPQNVNSCRERVSKSTHSINQMYIYNFVVKWKTKDSICFEILTNYELFSGFMIEENRV